MQAAEDVAPSSSPSSRPLAELDWEVELDWEARDRVMTSAPARDSTEAITSSIESSIERIQLLRSSLHDKTQWSVQAEKQLASYEQEIASLRSKLAERDRQLAMRDASFMQTLRQRRLSQGDMAELTRYVTAHYGALQRPKTVSHSSTQTSGPRMPASRLPETSLASARSPVLNRPDVPSQLPVSVQLSPEGSPRSVLSVARDAAQGCGSDSARSMAANNQSAAQLRVVTPSLARSPAVSTLSSGLSGCPQQSGHTEHRASTSRAVPMADAIVVSRVPPAGAGSEDWPPLRPRPSRKELKAGMVGSCSM